MGTKTARLEEIRQDLGLNKSQFASVMGVSPHYYYGILKGKGKANLRMEHVERLLEYANTNPVWLLTGEGEKYVAGVQVNEGEDEPTEAAVEALYNHLNAVDTPADARYLLKLICVRVLMEHPNVKSLDTLSMLVNMYRRIMERLGGVSPFDILGISQDLTPYMQQSKTDE